MRRSRLSSALFDFLGASSEPFAICSLRHAAIGEFACEDDGLINTPVESKSVRFEKKERSHQCNPFVSVQKRMVLRNSKCIRSREFADRRISETEQLPWTIQCRIKKSFITYPCEPTVKRELPVVHFSTQFTREPIRLIHFASSRNAESYRRSKSSIRRLFCSDVRRFALSPTCTVLPTSACSAASSLSVITITFLSPSCSICLLKVITNSRSIASVGQPLSFSP